MTHVILKEFYVDKETPYFSEYVKKFTDLPFLVTLKEDEGEHRSYRFLRTTDIDDSHDLGEWKTFVWDEQTNKLETPNGSQGFRWDEGKKDRKSTRLGERE